MAGLPTWGASLALLLFLTFAPENHFQQLPECEEEDKGNRAYDLKDLLHRRDYPLCRKDSPGLYSGVLSPSLEIESLMLVSDWMLRMR